MSHLNGVLAGAGFFAQFHAEAWRRVAGVHLRAVADLNLERASTFATTWGIPAVYADVGEMLRKERPDFLDIATGPDTHLALTALGASEKVHVICQKPMAPEWNDCVTMVEACERAGVRLLMHENWRWQPWYREMRRLQNGLGRPFHIAFRLRTGDGRGPEPYTVQPYFRGMKRFLVYETLVHFLDTFRYLGGEVDEVVCRSARVNPVIEGEDCVLVLLRFAGGAQGLIDANRISGPLPPEVTFGEGRVEGDRGMVRLSSDGRLWLTTYGEPEREHPYDIPALGYRGDSVFSFQQHCADCLRNGSPCESEGRDYLKTVRLVLDCYDSANRTTTR